MEGEEGVLLQEGLEKVQCEDQVELEAPDLREVPE